MRDAEALGADLRAARESRELSLAQAEQQTRIRAYYLEALENGTFDVLPSPVQGKGFLRNYARLLGLDPEIMAARFDSALNQRGRRSQMRQPQAAPPVAVDPPRPLQTRNDPLAPRPDTPSIPAGYQDYATVPRSTGVRRRRSVPNNAVALAGADARRQRSRNTTLGTIAILLISLIALFAIVALSLYTPPADSSLLLTPSLSRGTTDPGIIGLNPDATTDPASANITPSPSRPTPLPNPNTQQANSGNPGQVNVTISVKRRVALTVYADGKEVARGVFGPENLLQYQAATGVRIICGNADAIEVTVNGEVITDLGQSNQAIDRTFTGK